jgi:hypothetical protein
VLVIGLHHGAIVRRARAPTDTKRTHAVSSCRLSPGRWGGLLAPGASSACCRERRAPLICEEPSYGWLQATNVRARTTGTRRAAATGTAGHSARAITRAGRSAGKPGGQP